MSMSRSSLKGRHWRMGISRARKPVTGMFFPSGQLVVIDGFAWDALPSITPSNELDPPQTCAMIESARRHSPLHIFLAGLNS